MKNLLYLTLLLSAVGCSGPETKKDNGTLDALKAFHEKVEAESKKMLLDKGSITKALEEASKNFSKAESDGFKTVHSIDQFIENYRPSKQIVKAKDEKTKELAVFEYYLKEGRLHATKAKKGALEISATFQDWHELSNLKYLPAKAQITIAEQGRTILEFDYELTGTGADLGQSGTGVIWGWLNASEKPGEFNLFIYPIDFMLGPFSPADDLMWDSERKQGKRYHASGRTIKDFRTAEHDDGKTKDVPESIQKIAELLFTKKYVQRIYFGESDKNAELKSEEVYKVEQIVSE